MLKLCSRLPYKISVDKVASGGHVNLLYISKHIPMHDMILKSQIKVYQTYINISKLQDKIFLHNSNVQPNVKVQKCQIEGYISSHLRETIC